MNPFDAMVTKIKDGVIDEYGNDPVSKMKADYPGTSNSEALYESVASVAREFLPKAPSKAWIVRCLVAHPEIMGRKGDRLYEDIVTAIGDAISIKVEDEFRPRRRRKSEQEDVSVGPAPK